MSAKINSSPGALTARSLELSALETGLLLGSACERGDWGRLRELLEAGLNPNAKVRAENGDCDFPALPLYARSISLEGLRALLEHGADPHAKGRYGSLPMALIFRKIERFEREPSGEEIARKVALLASFGADPNEIGRDGATALMSALLHEDRPDAAALGIQALLEAGANPSLTGSLTGPDPLELACAARWASAVELLLAAGADPESGAMRRMEEAAARGEDQGILALLRAYAERRTIAETADPAASRPPKKAAL